MTDRLILALGREAMDRPSIPLALSVPLVLLVLLVSLEFLTPLEFLAPAAGNDRPQSELQEDRLLDLHMTLHMTLLIHLLDATYQQVFQQVLCKVHQVFQQVLCRVHQVHQVHQVSGGIPDKLSKCASTTLYHVRLE